MLRFVNTIHQKRSLAREFFGIILIVSILSLIFLIILILHNLNKYEKRENFNYNFEARLIDNILNENVNNLSNYIKFLGQKIITLPSKDINNISQTLISKIPDNLIEEAMFSWTLFDYVNPNKMLIFNSVKGIIDPPADMSSRKHLEHTSTDPWKLYFSTPIIGNPSDEYVIPAGMGIAANNKFYGTLVVGIRLSKIQEKIQRLFRDKFVSFILLDLNSNIIISSSDLKLPSLSNSLNIKNYTREDGRLKNSFTIENVEFTYNYKLKTFPYILLLGQNKAIKFNAIIQSILPNALQLIFFSAILIFIMYLLKHRISNPIKMLTSLAQKIANNEPIEITTSRYEEINILAKQLFSIQIVKNKLIQSQLLVKKANSKIKKNNQKLERKVSIRTQELQDALAAKTEFLNNMSHEIRTPIQGFTGISEGLVTHWDEFDDLKKRNLANEIYINSKRLYSLIGNLLDLSKFQQGKMLLFLNNTDMNMLIINMIEECKTLYINNKNIKFDYIEVLESKLIADQERISQVLRNLFTNAIKFTPKNKTIKIKVNKSQITYNDNKQVEAWHVSIIDEGVGIPEDELESIFDSFYQSSRTKTKAGGTGLGLAIVAKIIAAHNGKIWASNNLDKGASIDFVIPIIHEKKMLGAKIIAENNIILNYVESTKSLKILMIDDEESCLTTMELLLHNTNYKLIKVNGGREALEYLKNDNKVDLILLDLMMPDIYGLNLLKEIKNRKLFANIPVILQSGSVDEREIAKAFKLGIVAHIKKPYNKVEVINAIENVTSFNYFESTNIDKI